MTNLLSQPEQQALTKEYKHRRMIVVLFAIIATTIICTVFLVPSYILSNVKLSETTLVAADAQAASENLEKTKNTSSVILKNTERKLNLLKEGNAERSVYAAVNTITSNKIPEIKIQTISYVASTDKVRGTIAVSGLAKDRDSLTQFLKNMEAQPLFETVDLPVSNFAKDKDIPFSMQLFGNF